MARSKKVAQGLTPEEKLAQALVPIEKKLYKVPENWQWLKIGSVAAIYTGNSINERIKKEKYLCQKEGLLFIATKDVGFDNEINYNTEVRIPDYSNFKVAPENTTLLCIEGGSAGRKIGFIKQPVCFGNKLCAFSTKVIEPKYIYYFLQTQCFYDQFNEKKHGLIGGVAVKELCELGIAIAPFSEQKRISARIESIFAKLDEAKENAQTVVDGFEVRKASILYKAFSGELTKQWRKEHNSHRNVLLEEAERASEDWSKKEKNLLEIEQKKSEIVTLENGHEWIHCTIGAFCRITNGSTPSRQSPEYWSGNIPWISSGEVRNNIICASNECISEEGYNNSSVKLLPAGTVLIAMIGEGKTRGQSAILDIDATINQNIAAIMTDCGNILPRYIWYWLQMNYAKNRERGSGSGPQALNCQRVRELDFFVPNKEEQSEIVSILNSLIKKELQAKEAAESVLDQIDTMKKAVLARAFRGELGTNDPTEESAVELLKTML